MENFVSQLSNFSKWNVIFWKIILWSSYVKLSISRFSEFRMSGKDI